MRKVGAIVLAAGKSTRMRSATPKVLHPVCGRPLITYPVRAAIEAGSDPVVVVTNEEYKKDFVKIFEGQKNVTFAVQKKQLGTGDAVKAAQRLAQKCDYLLVVPGDVPLIKSSTLKKLLNETIAKNAVCGVLTMEFDNPADYGRIVRDSSNNIRSIVEAGDAGPEELLVHEVNSAIYCAQVPWVFEAISRITPQNSQKEYYFTDVVKEATSKHLTVIAQCVEDASEPMGVNTRKELGEANRLMRQRILDDLMSTGVSILDERNTYIDDGVKIGQDTEIAPNCFISGKTKIGRNCRIENGVVLKNSIIGDGSHIKPYSVIEDSIIKNDAQIGPFARFRPGVVIENGARIGNFVEIKKSIIKKGAKANHLSYIGDAVIGARTNVGCGTITCNYDGRLKHKTIIGDEVFIGSDVQFVAPVKVGRGATIGAGSTITDDVPANSLAIARGRQVIKKNWREKS